MDAVLVEHVNRLFISVMLALLAGCSHAPTAIPTLSLSSPDGSLGTLKPGDICGGLPVVEPFVNPCRKVQSDGFRRIDSDYGEVRARLTDSNGANWTTPAKIAVGDHPATDYEGEFALNGLEDFEIVVTVGRRSYWFHIGPTP